MALEDLLRISDSKKVKARDLTEDRVRAIIPIGRQYISYWRAYPDMFIDWLQTYGDPTKEKKLKFFFYQRIMLRVICRYRQTYFVFPRGFSKSFIAVLSMMIRCILYPGSKIFSAAGGKSQSASILKEKVAELCTLVPALANEIDRRPGKGTSEGKDKCVYKFKNDSYLDNVAANEKTRGGRRHAGVLEECVGIDGKILQEVLIPMMSISRRVLDGTKHPEEPLNKSQCYINFLDN